VNDRLLIATDLDRTLLPNGPQPESPCARELLSCLVAHPRVILAYVSGRHRELVEDAMAEWSLPRPDRVIGDVGTTIWHVPPSGEWSRDAAWEDAIGEDWAGFTAGQLADRLADIPELVLQPPEKQNRHKLSYFLPASTNMEAFEPLLRTRLRGQGIQARFVFSVDETEHQGLLDVLPERASKLHAIVAVADELALGPEDLVFCGDSGNDLEVLVSALPAVLVANATESVREAALAGARAAGTEDQLYCARGGFRGMNGCYAAGMLEGIAHYHPWTMSILDTKAGAA
jgi:HAD superfamily hydrolase (TIGR01484 family)